MKLRLLLVEDHPVYKYGLRLALSDSPDLSVVGDASSIQEALAQIDMGEFDVVLTDLQLSNSHGVDFIKSLKERKPQLPVLVISMHGDADSVTQALQVGASGYVTKSASSEEIITAVREVAAGRSYIQSRVAHVLVDHMRKGSSDPEPCKIALTPRERQILDFLCRGKNATEVGEALILSVATVKSHMRGLYRKFEVSSQAQLISKATQLGEFKAN